MGRAHWSCASGVVELEQTIAVDDLASKDKSLFKQSKRGFGLGHGEAS